MKPPSLASIAADITALLRRIATDPLLNPHGANTVAPYYFPSGQAVRGGVRVRYSSWQPGTILTREQASGYLGWLAAGHVGTHDDWQTTIKGAPPDALLALARASGKCPNLTVGQYTARRIRTLLSAVPGDDPRLKQHRWAAFDPDTGRVWTGPTRAATLGLVGALPVEAPMPDGTAEAHLDLGEDDLDREPQEVISKASRKAEVALPSAVPKGNRKKLETEPIGHVSRYGTAFRSSRGDLSEGVDVFPQPGAPLERLLSDVAEFAAGFHAMAIRPELSAFTGYDAVVFRLKDGNAP